MEGEPSWVGHPAGHTAGGRGFQALGLFSASGEDVHGVKSAASLDALPDDLLEKILAFLPFRAYSEQDASAGDGTRSNWFVSSSRGLVCFMDNDSSSRLFVCNPITRHWKRLNDPPGGKFSDYSALSIYVDGASRGYTICVVKCRQVPGDFLRWDLSIHVYDSGSRNWATPAREMMTGWRGGDESVICGGVLYCLIYCTGRHHVQSIGETPQGSSLLRSSVPAPCSLTCGRLMNLRERLVMGIGIWELDKREWREVSRMPHRLFQGFGEFDDVFASSGTGDLIYIQSYGAPALLVFDMNQRQWRWSVKCPVAKRFPLQLFSGFSFEPRLEVSP
ncbi:unnamed protein product [Spirodela intermedia]|uniref:F-box protein At3g26010-like beta-propeller domain-containing protein n=1 Tax=Spirodela intermedia TaxID=51605 RepID=A0A7I8J6Q0_SPIIN|nr:unnamed protein product [Spirodela intermedia]CAA6665917.1 unnamed protein product [Spirodela intermedia]